MLCPVRRPVTEVSRKRLVVRFARGVYFSGPFCHARGESCVHRTERTSRTCAATAFDEGLPGDIA